MIMIIMFISATVTKTSYRVKVKLNVYTNANVPLSNIPKTHVPYGMFFVVLHSSELGLVDLYDFSFSTKLFLFLMAL